MRFYNFVALSLFMLLPLTAFAQSERHNEITAKDGDLYMFMKVGTPITPEQLYFMTQVNNKMKNLRVLTHFQQLSQKELVAWNEDPKAFTKRYNDPNAMFDEKKAKKYIDGSGEFSVERLEDPSMLRKLGVKTFPSMVYLTPDGFVYRFPLEPFKSEKPISEFWKAYEKHKGKGKKLFLEKQWSVQ